MKIHKSLLISLFGKNVLFSVLRNFLHQIDFFSPIFSENLRPSLATPTLNTSFIVHRGNTAITPRPSLPSSMMCWNFTCKSKKFQATFIAGTRRLHRYRWTRGGIPKFNPFHPNPLSTGWGGFLKKHPICTVRETSTVITVTQFNVSFDSRFGSVFGIWVMLVKSQVPKKMYKTI